MGAQASARDQAICFRISRHSFAQLGMVRRRRLQCLVQSRPHGLGQYPYDLRFLLLFVVGGALSLVTAQWSRTSHEVFVRSGHRTSSTRSAVRRPASGPVAASPLFPALTVFDLDACFWDKETFELDKIPSRADCVRGPLASKGEGVVAVNCGNGVMQLNQGSLVALQAYIAGECGDMKIGLASSAVTPDSVRIAKSALKLLEVIPGTTVWHAFMSSFGDDRAVRIGRDGPLSADKSETHFPLIKEATGVRYDEMLFFDDCIWTDHCADVGAGCIETDTGDGPVTHRTPDGLQRKDWLRGLEKWRQRRTGSVRPYDTYEQATDR